MAFYLGLGKRRNELYQQGDNVRSVLKLYSREFLDKNMHLCLGLAITFYSLWAADPLTIERVGNNRLIWTVPIALLICLKYSMIIEGDSDGDPIEVVFKDKILLLLIAAFAVLTALFIYF